MEAATLHPGRRARQQRRRGILFLSVVLAAAALLVALAAPALPCFEFWASSCGASPRGTTAPTRTEAPSAAPPPARADDDAALASSLRRRKQELEAQTGRRRFRVCTQLGFLNVHTEPGDPYDNGNIVGRLYEGDIVTGLEERDGWLHHDQGGWSVRFWGGFEWLQPIDDWL